jgi:uncharacterized DUF497 family protein
MAYLPYHGGRAELEWDGEKDRLNRGKHGVAFFDPRRVIAEDLSHSGDEQRYFCFGQVDSAVLTVRFTYRGGRIRIIGAGFWRKGKTIYERKNGPLHQG